MRTTELRIADAGNLESGFNSIPYQVYYLIGFSFDFEWSGNPQGKIYLECCNNDEKTLSTATWKRIPETDIKLKGTSGKFTLNVSFVQFRHVRFVYERTSGAGQLSTYFIGKGR